MNSFSAKNVSLKAMFSFCLLSIINISNMSAQPQFYDLRTLGLITPVKDQGSCGACWAFATIASIESNWLKNGYGSTILSEDNLIDCHQFDETPCAGGSFYMSNALLSRHGGPLLNIDDPYTPTLNNCAMSQTFPPSIPAYTDDIRFLPNNKDSVKQAIMTYGAIATSMFFNPANYNSAKYKYYDNSIGSTDSLYPHCVTLAGWNDTMSFPGAPGNGAWIIKDSYGTSWAQSGYFYVSFYDAGILSETAFFPARYNVPAFPNSPHIYYYDTYGWVDNYGIGSNNAYGLVKYTIFPGSGTVFPQQIKRIGTYAIADNTTLYIDLYRNFNGNVLSDHFASKTMFCSYKGYYTIPFSLPTDSIGSTIYIKVKYSCPVGVGMPVPVEKYEAGHTSGISLSNNSCYYSNDGNNWVVCGQGSSLAFDLCIKMYTEDAPLAKISVLKDTVCAGEMLHFQCISPPPFDSIRWLHNGNFISSGMFTDINFSSAGTHIVQMVIFSGINNDTASRLITVQPLPLTPTISQNGDTLVSSPALYYQWYDNAGFIPGEVNMKFKPLVSGMYFVEVTDINDCSSMSAGYYYSISGIKAYENEKLIVFPVPFCDELQYFCTLVPYEVIIRDMSGRILIRLKPSNNEGTINTTILKDGMYLVSFYNESETINLKVVKKQQ